uniref:Uncharacterized protein n=1 Tax=Avena sativa TaxID=4498 RepID=A0ACD5XIT1_AVESA
MPSSSSSSYASALHRRTHRVTSALAHAALEWTLIALLLLNGLLSHALARFAAYFALTPPCLLCARVDRLFGFGTAEADADDEAAGDARWLRGLLCGAHAAEISGMGYCLRHRRLVAEATDMCDGCLSSWSKEKRDGGAARTATACSCCEALVEGVPSRATRPREIENPPPAAVHDDKEDQGYVLLDQEDHEEEEEEQAEAGQQNEEEIEAAAVEYNESLEEIAAGNDRLKAMLYWFLWITMDAVEEDGSVAQSEEIVAEDDRLVPVVPVLDEVTIADDSDAGEGEDGMNRVDDLDTTVVVLEEEMMLAPSVATAPAMMENSIPQDEELVPEDSTVETGDFRTEEEDIVVPQVTEAVPEDGNRSAEVEPNCEVSIGSDICEQEQDGRAVPFQELVALEELFSPLDCAEDPTLPPETLHETSRAEQETSETEQRSDYLSNDQIESDQDRAPETPTYSFTAQNSGKRFLLERKLSLSLSMDGSVSSEIEGGEPPTIDQLKSTLQTERKALSAMYAELEEERNAAAIATNQTMAMINRLQEEKAAMQMEALQYQRMMEEQSEYDQEAMQLLTELVTKREREKQEMERELELCKQKLLHYEDRERTRMTTFNDNGNGTSVSSSDEDSDENSDDDCELGESPGGDEDNLQSSPDAALSPRTGQENTSHLAALDDSLTYFEMERLSILDELKTLEERLFTLEDDDTNVAPRDHSPDHYELSTDGVHSPQNGLTGGSKAKSEGRSSVSRGKSLLPLFDAVGDCDRTSSAEADDSTKPVAVFAKEQERLAIIEEVDHVYERLQALEADKEFLRHCIKSLKTGDKGMYLLQEILQHLRELRNVELHVKNAGGGIAANSA